MPALEIWGGVECTVNRVGDRFFDQLERTQHCARPEDVDRFAELGIRALRLPLLWERMQPTRDGPVDWSWADQVLPRLREHGVRPIIGLLHHGYGPPWTGVLDPHFVEHFARYARTVAERYPWVDAYTPINEPLTTARFSGLYGHWYPHARDDATFVRLLLAQYRAVAAAMREVREVNPDARLVQTEDLGRVESTPALAYQRDFENERRWLTWDVLGGRVGTTHPLWEYLRAAGCAERDLAAFADRPCDPDVIGVNYYVTSERFLDDRIERYPPEQVGSNGRHAYADVALVHATDASRAGVEGVLREAWQRYRRPLAVTECHLGCTREEQMRWLSETWDAAVRVRDEGVDLRAVTSWALLGSYDWHSLVTREDGHYEAGAFDARAPRPRPTAIAHMIRSLATHGTHSHAVLGVAGWWRHHARTHPKQQGGWRESRDGVLITGATGTLGRELASACATRGIAYHLLGRTALDIADHASVVRALERYHPWAVINAAGYVQVDRAEIEHDRCMRENVLGAVVLAAECARRDVRFVTYSSDLVFDGSKGVPYVESDSVGPLNVYGHSKALAEAAVLGVAPPSLVIRTSAFVGPWDEYNVVTQAMRALQEGDMFVVPHDLVVTPTYVPDLAHATLDLLLDGERGLWHLTNGTAVTWAELVRAAAERVCLSTDSLIVCSAAEMPFLARRPCHSALASERGGVMPPLESALERYAGMVADQLAGATGSEAGRETADAAG